MSPPHSQRLIHGASSSLFSPLLPRSLHARADVADEQPARNKAIWLDKRDVFPCTPTETPTIDGELLAPATPSFAFVESVRAAGADANLSS